MFFDQVFNVENKENTEAKNVNLNSFPDISKWNTSNIGDMSGLFEESKKVISLPDISKWDTKNVIDMTRMFSMCKSIYLIYQNGTQGT